MATDIYCPLDCLHKRGSGLCDLNIIVLEPQSELGGVWCEDFESEADEEDSDDERS